MSTELGPTISEHKGRFAAGGLGWYIGGIMFAASIVGVFKSLIAGDFMQMAGMLPFVGATGLWLFWLYSKWKQSLTIHQLGFVHQRLFREPRVVRFDQVAQVNIYRVTGRQSLHTKGIHVVLTLALRGGGEIILTNDIADIEQLATYAQPGGPAAGGANQGGAIGAQKDSPWA